MSKPDMLWERVQSTRLARFLSHPLVVLCIRFATILVVIAVIVLFYGQSVESTRASHVADRKVAALQVKFTGLLQSFEKAQQKATADRAAQVESARALFCQVVRSNASSTPPPTTARGFAQQKFFTDLGKTPLLHCFDP